MAQLLEGHSQKGTPFYNCRVTYCDLSHAGCWLTIQDTLQLGLYFLIYLVSTNIYTCLVHVVF